MPIQRTPGNLLFDPDLPPSNPPLTIGQPFPTTFALSGNLDFDVPGDPNYYFFSPTGLSWHGPTVRRWTQLIERLLSPRSMIAMHPDMTFDQSTQVTLHSETYKAVNQAYRNARTGQYNMPEDRSTGLHASSQHPSSKTADALDMITRGTTKPDFAIAVHVFNLVDRPHPRHYMEMLCTAKVTQKLNEVNNLKSRMFLIGSTCEAMRHIAYGNRMFGARCGLLVYASCFRRMLLVQPGVLLVDLGPGDEVIDMRLEDLLLFNTDPEDSPLAIYYELRPESVVEEGAGLALSSFLTQMGQAWINDNLGIPDPANFGLSGKVARVQGFSLERLAQAVSAVRVSLEGLVYPENGPGNPAPPGPEPGPGYQADPNAGEEQEEGDLEEQDEHEEQGEHDEQDRVGEDGAHVANDAHRVPGEAVENMADSPLSEEGSKGGWRSGHPVAQGLESRGRASHQLASSCGTPLQTPLLSKFNESEQSIVEQNTDALPILDHQIQPTEKQASPSESDQVPSLYMPNSNSSSGLTSNSFPSMPSIKEDDATIHTARDTASRDGEFLKDMLISQVEERNEQLHSLHNPDASGFTPAQKAKLRMLGQAAIDAGYDLNEHFPL